MSTEILWAIASGTALVALALVAVRLWRYRWSIGSVLDRLVRWWLYEWWRHDGKWRNRFNRKKEIADAPEVTVSQPATQAMRKALAHADGDSDRTLRLWKQPGGAFLLVLDQVREGDQVVESDGRDILAVDSDLLQTSGRITIDWREDAEDARFIISARR